LQPCDEARGIPAPPAYLLDLRIELIDQRGDGKARPVPSRLVEANREILAYPIHGEAEIEFAVDHGAPAIVHLPGLGRAFRDRVDDLLHVEAGAHAEMKRFGEAFDQASDADLVDHLGKLAGARRADQI